MRKFLTIIAYTIIILFIGRNLPILPKFYIFSSAEEEQNIFTQNLKQETKNVVKAATGSYGVYFADLNNPRHSFGLNEKEIFTAASVNKAPIVAVLYYLDNKRQISLDEKVTIQPEDIQAYGTGSLQNREPGGVYSLKTLAKLALQQSDNTAAHVLAKRIGMPLIQKTINEWGLTQTDMESNKTSAYDMYLLFKKLYKAEITSVAKTQELFGFMIDTDIEDRLPAQLPPGSSAYHKTGDAIGTINDVGIISKDKTVFYLGVMTADVNDEEAETKQAIAKIAKTILNNYDKRE